METYSKDTTLRDYLRIIFKHKYLLVITVIPIVIINYMVLEFKTPVYEASVKMLVRGEKTTEAEYYKERGGGGVAIIHANHAALVNSKQVLAPVVMALKLYEVPDDYERRFASPLKRWWINYSLKGRKKFQKEKINPEQEQAMRMEAAILRLGSRIRIEPVAMSDLFLIKAMDFNPVASAIIANSVSRSYVIFDLQQQLAEFKLRYGEKHSTSMQIQSYIKDLEKTLDGKPLTETDILWPASVKVIEQAEIPSEPAKFINKTFSLIISVIGGLSLGVVLSLLIGYFDQRFKSPHDIETFLKIPFLGSIPKVRKRSKPLIQETKQPANYVRAFHYITEQIYLLIKDKQLKSILITDIESSNEILVIVANLANEISKKTGKNVLIIDSNLRNSTLAQTLNVPNTPGLREVLEGKVKFEETIHDIDSNIGILFAGNSDLNPLYLITTRNMTEVINKAGEKYEIVFVVCEGLNDYQDAVVMSSMVDGIILVIDEGKDRRQVVKFAINPMEQRKANIMGVILNNRTYVIPKIIYRLT
jgi:capsular exopolysaccharide synthesis family protein